MHVMLECPNCYTLNPVEHISECSQCEESLLGQLLYVKTNFGATNFLDYVPTEKGPYSYLLSYENYSDPTFRGLDDHTSDDYIKLLAQQTGDLFGITLSNAQNSSLEEAFNEFVLQIRAQLHDEFNLDEHGRFYLSTSIYISQWIQTAYRLYLNKNISGNGLISTLWLAAVYFYDVAVSSGHEPQNGFISDAEDIVPIVEVFKRKELSTGCTESDLNAGFCYLLDATLDVLSKENNEKEDWLKSYKTIREARRKIEALLQKPASEVFGNND